MRELSLKNCRLDGRYDIQETLGRGSYAEIFVARDILAAPQSPHSLVVIKALNVFLQNDLDHDLEQTLVENFQNEAVALDRVRHPNIISRLGHGSARDLNNTIFHYLVLEYLPGGDLSKACRENKLNLLQAFDYLEQVCAGLSHAHKSDVIHRDIKPQNLLLTRDRQTVKIADFGVARFSQSDSPITRVGTNIYAPPEHSPMISGDLETITVTELTPAADIYSLAKSAYVLITCESPRFFANHPITELPFALRQKPWAAELIVVLKKATHNDSRQRQQNVEEFWRDLARVKELVLSESSESETRKFEQPHTLPQAHVASGYSPMAPLRPRFNTSQDLKLNDFAGMNRAPLVVPVSKIDAERKPPAPPELAVTNEPVIIQKTVKKRNFFKNRAVVLIICLGLFAGILYATHNFMRGRGFLPSIGFFSQKNGKANGDVFLRSTPNTNNPPIGVITKNSRLKIVNSQDDWLEIDIIEQGNANNAPDSASHGWVNGKFVDIQEQNN